MNEKQNLPTKKQKRDVLECLTVSYEPDYVKEMASRELKSKDQSTPICFSKERNVIKALTLREFDNGLLMAWGLKDEYRTFAVQLSREYQLQYKCDTAGKRSLAELAALNYCRVLEVQRRMNNVLEKDRYCVLVIKMLAVLSKEQDRAQRHYLMAIQTLEMGVFPQMKVNVKAGVANIANQQVIQEGNGIKTK